MKFWANSFTSFYRILHRHHPRQKETSYLYFWEHPDWLQALVELNQNYLPKLLTASGYPKELQVDLQEYFWLCFLLKDWALVSWARLMVQNFLFYQPKDWTIFLTLVQIQSNLEDWLSAFWFILLQPFSFDPFLIEPLSFLALQLVFAFRSLAASLPLHRRLFILPAAHTRVFLFSTVLLLTFIFVPVLPVLAWAFDLLYIKVFAVIAVAPLDSLTVIGSGFAFVFHVTLIIVFWPFLTFIFSFFQLLLAKVFLLMKVL